MPELNTIFVETTLPTGGALTVYEGKGRHFFAANKASGGDSSLLVKFLLIELCLVNGEKLTEAAIDEMHMRDVNYMGEVISSMLSNELPKLY